MSLRNSMHSVMAHTGFGELKICRPNGVTIIVPQNQIDKATGNPKKKIAGRLNELTRENIEMLESEGIKLFVGGHHA